MDILENNSENSTANVEPEAAAAQSTSSYEMSLDAQEKLNQRREARRRKILENAKSRLDKLNGRTALSAQCQSNHSEQNHLNQNYDSSSTRDYSDPEVEPDQLIFNQPRRQSKSTVNSTASTLETPIDFQNFLRGAAAADDNILGGNSMGVDARSAVIRDSTILKFRLHVLIPLAISYILSITGYFGGNMYGVFIPSGACIALELLFFREQKQMPPLTSLVISLCGIRPDKANIIWQVLSTVQALVIDLGLAVFLFSAITFILSFFCKQYEYLVIVK